MSKIYPIKQPQTMRVPSASVGFYRVSSDASRPIRTGSDNRASPVQAAELRALHKLPSASLLGCCCLGGR